MTVDHFSLLMTGTYQRHNDINDTQKRDRPSYFFCGGGGNWANMKKFLQSFSEEIKIVHSGTKHNIHTKLLVKEEKLLQKKSPPPSKI